MRGGCGPILPSPPITLIILRGVPQVHRSCLVAAVLDYLPTSHTTPRSERCYFVLPECCRVLAAGAVCVYVGGGAGRGFA